MSAITKSEFLSAVGLLGRQAREDIDWAESLSAPTDADDFALEAIFVICNSGMKNTIARKIFHRVRERLRVGGDVSEAFGHRGNVSAIEDIWKRRTDLLAAYLKADDKLQFCAELPWIGEITKYHLAKNFGADVAKPDVHLQRLADREGVTPQQLCERLARETGWRVATVDTLLWRACANGIINSTTGEIALA